MVIQDFERVADGAGLLYSDSILMVSGHNNLNSLFTDGHFKDVEVISKLPDLDQYRTSKFDKVVIVASTLNEQSVLDRFQQAAHLSRNMVFIYDLRVQNKIDFLSKLSAMRSAYANGSYYDYEIISWGDGDRLNILAL